MGSRCAQRAAVGQTLDRLCVGAAKSRLVGARTSRPDGGGNYDRKEDRRLRVPPGVEPGTAGQSGDPRIAQAAGGGISAPAHGQPGCQSRHGAGREHGSAGRDRGDLVAQPELTVRGGVPDTSLILSSFRSSRQSGFGGCKSRPAGLQPRLQWRGTKRKERLTRRTEQGTPSTDGNTAIEWALEAIAVALCRIATAIEKQNEEAELEPDKEP